MRFSFIYAVCLILGFASAFGAETVKIAFLASDKLTPANGAIYNGARDALKELGSRFDKKFELVYISADASAQKQATQMSGLYLDNYSGAVITAVHGAQAKLAKIIPELRARGFYVASAGAEIPDAQCVYHTGTDPEKFSVALQGEISRFDRGRKMETLCYFYSPEKNGNIDISDSQKIDGLVYPNLNYASFEKIFKPINPQKLVEMQLYSVYAKANRVEIMRYDNFGEVFFGPQLLANMAPITSDTDRRYAICVGALPQIDFYLSQKQIDACIYDDYYGWGYFSARALAEKISENMDAENPVRLLPPLIARPSNAADFKKDWEKWLK